ncbi:uncharacterized protein LOC124474950 isoform X2 [Hypomesus transpacificus]|uniref:uncharacterized protein LOC124474950 isoform X2 n=1 Tax=Hypomesus transpacificus TaxID=137520 RepID=UPI001F0719C3|nr:uncharacterized protein LOC124474950 isoform X2 [Hypomesus transpacificus]
MNSKMFVLLVLVNTVKATESNTIYLKVGDQLALPGGINTPVQHILWKLNANKVVEWDPFFKTTVYGEFKNRTTLDIATGHISIRDVRISDSGIFYFEFNHTQHKSIKISVINEVPTPRINSICDTHMTSCSLTCEGDIAEAGTVTYSWKADEAKLEVSDKTHIHENKNTEAFTCMMENSVSQMESAPHRNTLYSPVPVLTAKTLIGISIFVLLITAIIVLVFMHKCKSGVWFYETESMPWETGFWRKQGNSGDQESPEINQSENDVQAGAAEDAVTKVPKEEDKLMTSSRAEEDASLNENGTSVT